MNSTAPFRFFSDARTDVGKVRKVNEDAVLARPEIGLWVVADGMGGHTAGDVASGAVVEVLASLKAPANLPAFIDEVENRLIETNAKLREAAEKNKNQTIGCTVAVLITFDAYALCLWAGDSRVYRYRDRRLERLTQDHALVEDLVEQGMLTREEAERHPQGNLITRAVGATDDLFLDVDIYEVQDKDLYMLCSDGLTKEVSEEDMVGILSRESGEDKSNALVDLALARGARDNTTVITVRAEQVSPIAPKVAPAGGGNDETVPSATMRGIGN